MDDHQVVEFYDIRADRSENRIKELRSDFAAAHLLCSGFDANAIWFTLCSIAYNLLALKLNADHRAVLDQAIWSIRHCVLK